VLVAEDVNRSISGRPSPVRLDVYQLTANHEFNQSDYFDLADNAEESLGDKLIQRDRHMVRPGALMNLTMQLDSHTKYVGIVAGYREYDEKKWKLTLVKQDKKWFQVGGDYLYLQINADGIYKVGKDDMKSVKKERKAAGTEKPKDGEPRLTDGKKADLSEGILVPDVVGAPLVAPIK
ncbi:MAG: type VI secretion system lipoprotein TssJ, partial [Neisseriaceae bacterium]|nr:type VI secretion system lipoprotein TssJ [Neisseriaceae bacterium]